MSKDKNFKEKTSAVESTAIIDENIHKAGYFH
jgi:hypothetical protein